MRVRVRGPLDGIAASWLLPYLTELLARADHLATCAPAMFSVDHIGSTTVVAWRDGEAVLTISAAPGCFASGAETADSTPVRLRQTNWWIATVAVVSVTNGRDDNAV